MDDLFESDDENDFEINEDDFDNEDFLDDEDDSVFSQSDYEDDEEEEIDFDDEKEPPFLVEELTKQYFEAAHEFVKEVDKKFNFSATSAENISLPQIKKIYENFEIVSWYHAFIFVKTKRAAHGKKEFIRYKDKDLKEFSKSDSDGTAKVAALSVQNSLKAFSHLQECLPDYGTDIIKLSSLLQRIFKEIEREFPDYSKFKRPGLDD